MADADFNARKSQLRVLFTDMITAYGAKDFETFATFMRDDTLFEWPYLPLKDFPASMIGGDAFVASSKVGMEKSDPYNHTVDAFYDQVDPDLLIVEYHSDTGSVSDRPHYANKYLGIVRFKDDKVVYWKEYVNPLPILEVYGSDFSNSAATPVIGEA